jgi:hypothetical protein
VLLKKTAPVPIGVSAIFQGFETIDNDMAHAAGEPADSM